MKVTIARKVNALLRVMSPQASIKVVFGRGASVSFAKDVLTLPVIDFNDADQLRLLEGCMDHEIGHVDETDTAAGREAVRLYPPVVRDLWNCIEDVRMEKCRIEKWPGSRRNLSGLVDQAIKQDWFAVPDESRVNWLLISSLLYHGRTHHLQQDQLRGFNDVAQRLLPRCFAPEVVSAIQSVHAGWSDLSSSFDCLEAAVSVYKALKSSTECSEDDTQDPGDDAAPGTGGESGDADDQPEDADGESGDADGQPEDADSESGDADGQPEDTDGKSDGADGVPDDASGNDGSDQHKARNAAEVIEADETMPDLHDLVRGLLEQHHSELNAQDRLHPLMPQLETVFCRPGRVELDQAVVSTTRQVFQQAMIARRAKPVRHDRRGTHVNPNRLAGIGCGRLEVFRRRQQRRDVTGAVGFVVDSSSSVNTSQMVEINKLVLSMTTAITGLRGLDAAALYYRTSQDFQHELTPERDAYLALSFGDKVRPDRFGVWSSGGTPTGNAMMTMAYQLAGQEVDKKVMIVVTDGEPDSHETVEQALALCADLGIQAFCLGFNDAVQGGFDDADYAFIGEHLESAQAVIRTELKRRLFA
ncbi:vWA domain-containing protein [Ferrimonas kyonanensis]|uniref:vWA domain-containing protein n=1 Tax=Ferrimonas kyonanensis TaxID=364763 RepID=UPI00041DB678|nr:vWA domain-containing protein [Ferrimonas kyonanensis]